jgi:hypothetical protein
MASQSSGKRTSSVARQAREGRAPYSVEESPPAPPVPPSPRLQASALYEAAVAYTSAPPTSTSPSPAPAGDWDEFDEANLTPAVFAPTTPRPRRILATSEPSSREQSLSPTPAPGLRAPLPTLLALNPAASPDSNALAVSRALSAVVDFLSQFVDPSQGPLALGTIGLPLRRLATLATLPGWEGLYCTAGNELPCSLGPTVASLFTPAAVVHDDPMGEPTASGTGSGPPPTAPLTQWAATQPGGTAPKPKRRAPPPPPPRRGLTRQSEPSRSYAAAAARGKGKTQSKAPPPRSEGLGNRFALLAQAFPNLSPADIVALDNSALTKSTGSAAKRSSKMTTSGPSRHQLLLTFPGPQELDLLRLTASVNKSLTDSKAALRIESASKAYKGFSLRCSQVPTSADIVLVRQSIVAKCLNGVNLDFGLVLPASKSYLKVLDVPVLMGGTTVTPSQVETAMMSSPLHKDFALVGQIRLVRNASGSDTSSAYFEVWDSQAGTRGKSLARSTFQFGLKALRVVEAIANPGAPLCRRCWKWGHTDAICKARMPRCNRCPENHSHDGHRQLSSCCRGHPKRNPPLPPTAEGAPCPHQARCPNCQGPHQADDRKCSFWKHRFDRAWIQNKYSQVRELRAPNRSRTDAPSHV